MEKKQSTRDARPQPLLPSVISQSVMHRGSITPTAVQSANVTPRQEQAQEVLKSLPLSVSLASIEKRLLADVWCTTLSRLSDSGNKNAEGGEQGMTSPKNRFLTKDNEPLEGIPPGLHVGGPAHLPPGVESAFGVPSLYFLSDVSTFRRLLATVHLPLRPLSADENTADGSKLNRWLHALLASDTGVSGGRQVPFKMSWTNFVAFIERCKGSLTRYHFAAVHGINCESLMPGAVAAPKQSLRHISTVAAAAALQRRSTRRFAAAAYAMVGTHPSHNQSRRSSMLNRSDSVIHTPTAEPQNEFGLTPVEAVDRQPAFWWGPAEKGAAEMLAEVHDVFAALKVEDQRDGEIGSPAVSPPTKTRLESSSTTPCESSTVRARAINLVLKKTQVIDSRDVTSDILNPKSKLAHSAWDSPVTVQATSQSFEEDDEDAALSFDQLAEFFKSRPTHSEGNAMSELVSPSEILASSGRNPDGLEGSDVLSAAAGSFLKKQHTRNRRDAFDEGAEGEAPEESEKPLTRYYIDDQGHFRIRRDVPPPVTHIVPAIYQGPSDAGEYDWENNPPLPASEQNRKWKFSTFKKKSRHQSVDPHLQKAIEKQRERDAELRRRRDEEAKALQALISTGVSTTLFHGKKTVGMKGSVQSPASPLMKLRTNFPSTTPQPSSSSNPLPKVATAVSPASILSRTMPPSELDVSRRKAQVEDASAMLCLAQQLFDSFSPLRKRQSNTPTPSPFSKKSEGSRNRLPVIENASMLGRRGKLSVNMPES